MTMWQSRLSIREKLLLGTCADHGTVQFVPGGLDLAIAINSNQIDRADPLRQRQYLEAFMRLCKLGYFSADNGLFRPTAKGHERARKLSLSGWMLFPLYRPKLYHFRLAAPSIGCAGRT